MSLTTLETVSGHAVDLADPNPSQINVQDICHALSRIVPYGGHSSKQYTCAEHVLTVFFALTYRFAHVSISDLTRIQIAYFIKRAAAAYTGEFTGPLCNLLDFRVPIARLESRLSEAVARRMASDAEVPSGAFILRDSEVPLVRESLKATRRWETYHLLHGGGYTKETYNSPIPTNGVFEDPPKCWPTERAHAALLGRITALLNTVKVANQTEGR